MIHLIGIHQQLLRIRKSWICKSVNVHNYIQIASIHNLGMFAINYSNPSSRFSQIYPQTVRMVDPAISPQNV